MDGLGVRSIVLIIVSFLGVAPVRSQVVDTSNNEIYMLAFMNITTDDPSLDTFQQLILSGFKIDTNFQAHSLDYTLNQAFVIPQQTNGIIGTHELQTNENFVAPVDDVVTNLGLFAVGDNRLSMQMVKSVQASADGYQALPLTEESTHFFIMSYDVYPGGHSTFAVVALEDSTCVSINRVNGTEVVRYDFVTLDAFQVYNGLSHDIDFTGYEVVSNKPVTVVSGHMCARVPVNVPFCDHLQEQIPPNYELGTHHNIPGIYGRHNLAGYRFRVVATVDGTDISVNGLNVATINRGVDFYEGIVQFSREDLVVECSDPCLVAQFNTGYLSNTDPNAVVSDDTKKTDPYMTIIPAIDHYEKELRFGTANFYADGMVENFENYLAIMVPTADKYRVSVNLEYLPANTAWYDQSNGYSIANVAIAHGLYYVSSDTGEVDLMAIVYGHGRSHITAYGYPAGYKMTGTKLRTSRLQRESGVGGGTNPVLGTCTQPFDTSLVKSTDQMQVFYVTFQLKNQYTSPCSQQAITAMEGVLDDVKNVTNWLICLDLLCIPATDTWVYAIDIVAPQTYDPLTSITFRVSIWSNTKEVMKNGVACKRHVAQYLRDYGAYSARWKVPLTVSGGACPVLDFQVPGTIQNAIPTCTKTVNSS